MKWNHAVLALLLSGATALGTAQMMPGPTGQTGGYPQAGAPGQQGRTMPGEIPNLPGTNDPNNPNSRQQGQQTTQPRVADTTLEHDVKQQLAADPAFSAVQVQVHNGRVELTGSVPEKSDRKKAKEMAKSVPGVTGVKEHLSVGGGNTTNTGANSPGSMSGSGQNTAGSISGNAGSSIPADSTTPAGTNNPSSTNPPDQTQPHSNPPQDNVPHAGLTTTLWSGGPRLETAAWQQPPTGSPDASAKGSQQAPNGAPSPAEKTASSTDYSSATPLAPGNDNSSALQSQIENAIRNEPSLANSHISVAVSEDAIDLTGTVPSSKDKVNAERLARSFGQNRQVKNNLVVTGHGTSDMAPDHPAMNNSGTGNSQQNPATSPNPHRR